MTMKMVCNYTNRNPEFPLLMVGVGWTNTSQTANHQPPSERPLWLLLPQKVRDKKELRMGNVTEEKEEFER